MKPSITWMRTAPSAMVCAGRTAWESTKPRGAVGGGDAVGEVVQGFERDRLAEERRPERGEASAAASAVAPSSATLAQDEGGRAAWRRGGGGGGRGGRLGLRDRLAADAGLARQVVGGGLGVRRRSRAASGEGGGEGEGARGHGAAAAEVVQ